jgi:hypothetical protein
MCIICITSNLISKYNILEHFNLDTFYNIVPQFIPNSKHLPNKCQGKRKTGKTCSNNLDCKSPPSIKKFLTEKDKILKDEIKKEIVDEVKNIINNSETKIIEKFENSKIIKNLCNEEIKKVPYHKNENQMNAKIGEIESSTNKIMTNQYELDDEDMMEQYYKYYKPKTYVDTKDKILGSNYISYTNEDYPLNLINDDLTNDIKKENPDIVGYNEIKI